MQIDKFSDQWLFETHTSEQISEWVNQLKYFYFFRAWGGHANDGDSFKATLKYTDQSNLIDILSKIGVTIQTIPPDYPRAITGKSYTYDEYKKFKTEIKDFPDLEQPSHSIINGAKCFIWVESNIITFSVFGTNSDLYNVTQADFDACKKIEAAFDNAELQNYIDLNIEKSASCISSKKYPELFTK